MTCLLSCGLITLKRGLLLKGQKLLPSGANSFLLGYIPFQKGAKPILKELPPIQSVSIPLRRLADDVWFLSFTSWQTFLQISYQLKLKTAIKFPLIHSGLSNS